MEDARKGPGKYAIEQPIIEVDVSKAYGVLALTAGGAAPLAVPENPRHEDVTSSGFTALCDDVVGATGYQWYLNGVPYTVTVAAGAVYSGLTAGSTVNWQVAGVDERGAGAATAAVNVTLDALSAPVWGVVGAQALTVGAAYSLDLNGAVSGGGAIVISLASGVLPPGLVLAAGILSGTPSVVGTWSPVFRAVSAGGATDSAAVSFEGRNADVTPPDVPTGLAAAGYSETQVRVTWVNPTGDAVVAGEWASGFLGVDVYRDGAKVARVLATDAVPTEYIASVAVGAMHAWSVRSVDGAPSFNKSALTAAVNAGPLAGGAVSSPEAFVVTRASGTSALLEWKRPAGGATPSSYRVYFSLTENGAYTMTDVGVPTPDAAGVYAYTKTTGFTAAQEPWFYVTAVVGGVEGAQTNKLKASVGVYTGYQSMNTLLGTASPPQLNKIYIPSDVDANAVDAFGSPDYVPDIPAGGGDKGMRLITAPSFLGGKYTLLSQLTFHDYGTNSPPSNIATQRWYPAANRWHHKGDYPSGDKAHRNEGALNLDTGWRDWPRQEERWAGFAVYLPGENDPYGLAPTRAMAAIPGNWSLGPQLHAANISGQQGFSPPLSFLHGSGGYSGFGTPTGISHPSGAPVVRYKRASSEPLGSILADTSATNWADNHSASRNNTASTLLMDWDAVPGASSYRVEYAWRPEGPWMTATTNPSDNITVDLAGRRACATGLSLAATALNMVDPTPSDGISAADIESWNQNWTRYLRVVPIIGGQDGVPSLICPAPNWHLSWGQGDYCEDARPYYGTWIRYVLRLKISTTVETVQPNGTTSSYANNDGYFQVWRNGQEVIWVPNAAIGLNSTKPHYWKMGIYHGHPGRLTTADIPRIPMHWAWRKQVLYAGLKAGYRTGGPTGRTDADDSAYLAVEPDGD